MIEVTTGDGKITRIEVNPIDELEATHWKCVRLMDEWEELPFYRIFRDREIRKELDYCFDHMNEIIKEL